MAGEEAIVTTSRIRVKEACHKCHSEGAVVVGAGEILKLSPRHMLPSLYTLGILVVVMLGLYAWVDYGAAVVSTDIRWRRWSAVAIAVCSGHLLLVAFPIRMLLCTQCRKVLGVGLGRKLPLAWLECIEPKLHCTKCGYSLVGVIESARCPECEYPFPEEWLKITEAADPDVEIEYEVVESY